jgi:hypothetical protein
MKHKKGKGDKHDLLISTLAQSHATIVGLI